MNSQNKKQQLLSKADTIIIIFITIGLILTFIIEFNDMSRHIFKFEQRIGFPLSLIIQLITLVLFVILALKFILNNYKKYKKQNKK